MNTATLANRGVPSRKIVTLTGWRESSLFGDRDRTSFEFVEATTLSDTVVVARQVSALHARWGEADIVGLAAPNGIRTMVGKHNKAPEVPAHGLCEMQQDREDREGCE